MIVQLIFIGGPEDGYRARVHSDEIGMKLGESLRINRSGHLYMAKPWTGVEETVRLYDCGRYQAKRRI